MTGGDDFRIRRSSALAICALLLLAPLTGYLRLPDQSLWNPTTLVGLGTACVSAGALTVLLVLRGRLLSPFVVALLLTTFAYLHLLPDGLSPQASVLGRVTPSWHASSHAAFLTLFVAVFGLATWLLCRRPTPLRQAMFALVLAGLFGHSLSGTLQHDSPDADGLSPGSSPAVAELIDGRTVGLAQLPALPQHGGRTAPVGPSPASVLAAR